MINRGFSSNLSEYKVTQLFAELNDCFSKWVAELATLTKGEVITIDGKCLRRSIDKAFNTSAIYMFSAWEQKNSLVLSQVPIQEPQRQTYKSVNHHNDFSEYQRLV
jgi:hypothetical protein